MRMTPRNCMRLVVVCLWGLIASISIAADQKPKTRSVHYSDMPGRVRIMGKLGRPLGQLVTVRGRWRAQDESKPGQPAVFVVEQVGGRLLDPPAEFTDVEVVWKEDAAFEKKTVGEEWELRGVETGGFVGFGDEVWEEVGMQAMSHPPRGFLTRFCYVKARRVSGSKPTGDARVRYVPPGVTRKANRVPPEVDRGMGADAFGREKPVWIPHR